MGAKYGAVSNATNTASATVPMFSLTGSTTKRARLYHLILGSDAAPANQANKFSVKRNSARGTSSAAVVANALDPADGAAITTYDTGWSVNPTITASSELLQIALNQQATAQWMVDPSNGLVIPATSGAGLSLMSVVTTSAVNFVFSSFFEE